MRRELGQNFFKPNRREMTMALFGQKKTSSKKPAKPVAAAAPKKAPAKKCCAVTPEERFKLIEQEAYFKAEKAGFQGDQHGFWVAAEAEIDARLKKCKK